MTVLQLATVPDNEPEDAPADMGAPPAPPPVRRRNRPPQPGTPAGGAPIASVPLSEADRNLAVVRMRMAGKRQSEIAAHYGRSVSTIATWYRDGKKALARTYRETTAEDIAAEIEHKFAISYARWEDVLKRAQLRGDLKLEIQAMARMDQSNVHRVQALERIGYFDQVHFKPEADREEDSVTRGRSELNMLLEMTNSILKGDVDAVYDAPDHADDAQSMPSY